MRQVLDGVPRRVRMTGSASPLSRNMPSVATRTSRRARRGGAPVAEAVAVAVDGHARGGDEVVGAVELAEARESARSSADHRGGCRRALAEAAAQVGIPCAPVPPQAVVLWPVAVEIYGDRRPGPDGPPRAGAPLATEAGCAARPISSEAPAPCDSPKRPASLEDAGALGFNCSWASSPSCCFTSGLWP